jgi:hypothetical protein
LKKLITVHSGHCCPTGRSTNLVLRGTGAKRILLTVVSVKSNLYVFDGGSVSTLEVYAASVAQASAFGSSLGYSPALEQ